MCVALCGSHWKEIKLNLRLKGNLRGLRELNLLSFTLIIDMIPVLISQSPTSRKQSTNLKNQLLFFQSMTLTKENLNFLYGTAWKEDRTENLVLEAVKQGFRAIDTANQRRHYYEEGVGKAISKIMKDGIKREELFIQTKYTHIDGQDHRLPYDADADYATQVKQSFQSSLEHLQLDHLDSYVLHGPLSGHGYTEDDVKVWNAMEELHKDKKTRYLGVSNVSIEQLKTLWDNANIKPSFVQNRCFAQAGWDKEIRNFCKKNDIIYQGFSLLTANLFVYQKIKEITEKLNKTPAQVIFRFSKQIGMLPITGTTDVNHMKEDLDIDFELNSEDMKFIENIGI